MSNDDLLMVLFISLDHSFSLWIQVSLECRVRIRSSFFHHIEVSFVGIGSGFRSVIGNMAMKP